MSATIVSSGCRIPYTPESDVDAGDVVVIGTMVCVAPSPIAAGTTGTVIGPVMAKAEMPKANVAITQGAACYWDATAGAVTTTATGNTYIGPAIEAAAQAATTVIVGIK